MGIRVGIVIFISIYGQWEGVEIKEKLILENIIELTVMMTPLKYYGKCEMKTNDQFYTSIHILL